MPYATRLHYPFARKEEGSGVPWPPHAFHTIFVSPLSKLSGRMTLPISQSRVATIRSVGPMMSIWRRGVRLRGKVTGTKPSSVEPPLRSARFGHASCARNRKAWSAGGGPGPYVPLRPLPIRSAARISTLHSPLTT
ncbi:hypothetical protein CALVIDRAFT_169599 [Calocera viscosa TUFC12733]|uniref:Uncharacterized protein n=1 Tax=Calocera viscosa (strain TUFC12733) TaxID=1330018 RepID=A0A167L6T8_CALVF|nr:hypothetical protein CALVIDRAFT_169599 [Calocera viscosa TUFC12733]